MPSARWIGPVGGNGGGEPATADCRRPPGLWTFSWNAFSEKTNTTQARQPVLHAFAAHLRVPVTEGAFRVIPPGPFRQFAVWGKSSQTGLEVVMFGGCLRFLWLAWSYRVRTWRWPRHKLKAQAGKSKPRSGYCRRGSVDGNGFEIRVSAKRTITPVS